MCSLRRVETESRFAYAVRITSTILRTARFLCVLYAEICINATPGRYLQFPQLKSLGQLSGNRGAWIAGGEHAGGREFLRAEQGGEEWRRRPISIDTARRHGELGVRLRFGVHHGLTVRDSSKWRAHVHYGHRWVCDQQLSVHALYLVFCTRPASGPAAPAPRGTVLARYSPQVRGRFASSAKARLAWC